MCESLTQNYGMSTQEMQAKGIRKAEIKDIKDAGQSLFRILLGSSES